MPGVLVFETSCCRVDIETSSPAFAPSVLRTWPASRIYRKSCTCHAFPAPHSPELSACWLLLCLSGGHFFPLYQQRPRNPEASGPPAHAPSLPRTQRRCSHWVARACVLQNWQKQSKQVKMFVLFRPNVASMCFSSFLRCRRGFEPLGIWLREHGAGGTLNVASVR